MTNSRPDQNYPPPGDEEQISEGVKDVTVEEQHQNNSDTITNNVPVCLHSDRPAVTSTPAAAGQFRPINLPPSTPTICIENGKITPLPIYPLKKRHVALTVTPLMPRYSLASTNGNVASTSSRSAPNVPASAPNRVTPLGAINMEIASEEFALEYARAPLAILPISCGITSAAIYIEFFASGSHGRCIMHKDRWLTPREFEDVSASDTGRDWKMNIKYGGHVLQKLIDAHILKKHHGYCSCDLCVPERPIGSTLEPLELTTEEYKRKYRDSEPERPPKRPRLHITPCNEVWQTAADYFEKAEAQTPRPALPPYPIPTSTYSDPTGIDPNLALNYSIQNSSSYQTPSYQSRAPSYQPTSSSYQPSSSSYQPSSSSYQPSSSSYQFSNSSYRAPVQSDHSSSSLYQNPLSSVGNEFSAYQGETSYEIAGSARPIAEILASTGLRVRDHNSHTVQVTNPHRNSSRPPRCRSRRNRRHLRIDTSFEPQPSTSRHEPRYHRAGASSSKPHRRSHNRNTDRVERRTQTDGDLGEHHNVPDCVLCRATSYCKQHCQRDGSLLHMPCCLHGMRLERIWNSSRAEPDRYESSLSPDLLADYTDDTNTSNPREFMTTPREFLVAPREYMPAPGEEVELLQAHVPPEDAFIHEDRPE